MIKYPLSEVILNVTELCNQKCSFCPRAVDYPNQNLHMSSEVAEEAILQTNPWTNYIQLGGRGEPLLCENLYNILELCVNYKRKIKIITNGDHLDKHLKILDSILNLKKESTKYKIMVNCYRGIKEYEERIKKYEKYRDIYVTMERCENNAEENIKNEKLTNRGGVFSYNNIHSKSPCYSLFHQVIINWNGDVNLCCHDWSQITHFGNILETSFEKIWEQGLLNEYRLQLIKGKRFLFKECKNCNSIENQKTSIPLYDKWLNGKVDRETQISQFNVF